MNKRGGQAGRIREREEHTEIGGLAVSIIGVGDAKSDHNRVK